MGAWVVNECIECDRHVAARGLCVIHLAELQRAEYLDDFPDDQHEGDDDE